MYLTPLLQSIGRRRLTDSKGRTIDFKNTILIMTSLIWLPTWILEKSQKWTGTDCWNAGRSSVCCNIALTRVFKSDWRYGYFQPSRGEDMINIVKYSSSNFRKGFETSRRFSFIRAKKLRFWPEWRNFYQPSWIIVYSKKHYALSRNAFGSLFGWK